MADLFDEIMQQADMTRQRKLKQQAAAEERARREERDREQRMMSLAQVHVQPRSAEKPANGRAATTARRRSVSPTAPAAAAPRHKPAISFDALMKQAEQHSTLAESRPQAKMTHEAPIVDQRSSHINPTVNESIPNRLVSMPSTSNRTQSRSNNNFGTISKARGSKQSRRPHDPYAQAHKSSDMVKLNTVKRDIRTVDEIEDDLRKARQLKNGKTDLSTADLPPAGRTSDTKRPLAGTVGDLPTANGARKYAAIATSYTPSLKYTSVPANNDATFHRGIGENTRRASASTGNSDEPSSSSSNKKAKSKQGPVSKEKAMLGPDRKPTGHRIGPLLKAGKPIVASSSPKFRLPADEKEETRMLADEKFVTNNYSDIIRGLFPTRGNTDASAYDDDASDDSDMEASARDIEREEKRSIRLAKREDEIELERERRRQEKLAKKRKLK